jgi:N-acylneuraminate cytidylyltransferase
MRLAIIPARGGSKRIPRKNVRLFCGKPIIGWSIDAALASGCFDRVLVSTDDAEIARIAEDWGAEVPFTRPPELSDDHTTTIPVIAHAILWALGQGLSVEAACCLYATAPFCEPDDLRRGLKLLEESDCDYVFPVAGYAFPIQRAIRITGNGRVQMFDPDQFGVRSQDLEPAYHDAGQFYWGRPDAWLEPRPIFSEMAVPLVLPRFRVQDIDTPEDWEFAETLFRLSRGP